MVHRILILGGTTEAREFAAAIADRPDLEILLSLAGRTASPAAQPVPVRSGGFGGAEGLAQYLRDAKVDVLVDATHPFAATISANAAEAVARTGTAHFAIRRPPWTKVEGDNWQEADSVEQAIQLTGDRPKRIFVALGRKEIAPLAAAPFHHYVIRSVDPLDGNVALPDAVSILARGPFDEDAELTLFREHGIELILAKNSGGHATYAKLAAARTLGIPVLMVRRPAKPDTESVATVPDAVALLDHLTASAIARGE